MSQDAPVGRKEKKALRDAERRKKGTKRKAEENDDGHAKEVPQDFIPLDGSVVDEAENSKDLILEPATTSRKRKATNVEGDAGQEDPTKPQPSKSKKRKTANSNTEGEATKPRFILFIGNLPYAATDAAISTHFRKLQPFTLRHRTDPKTKKSKGFAFLEFENYDRMKTCLKLYHHSVFDPAKESAAEDEDVPAANEAAGMKDKKNKTRRINVELTAGGGGKAEARKEKIKAKNVRLGEQRQRRAEYEKKEKAEREKDERPHSGNAGGDGDGNHDTAGIHPSRLSRIEA